MNILTYYGADFNFPQEKFKGANANILKLIAVTSMLIQHTAIIFLSEESHLYLIMFLIGKLTAPIMCFFIAEGYYHTRSKKKYLSRLFLGAVIAHIPHALALGFPIWNFWKVTSVMWSLFLGLAALMIFMKKDLPSPLRYLAVGICCILSYPGNWNLIAVLWVLVFGIFHDEKKKKWLAFFGVTLLYVLEFFVIDSGNELIWTRCFVLLAVPLLMLYNGKLGRKSKALQRGYYLFYPLHFMALYIINLLISFSG